MTLWLLLKPDEDGRPVSLLSEADLAELLNDPTETYGVRKFETIDFLQDNPDPNYWPDGIAVLLRAEVVLPQPVVSQWEIPR
jgi:hypothetical protein